MLTTLGRTSDIAYAHEMRQQSVFTREQRLIAAQRDREILTASPEDEDLDALAAWCASHGANHIATGEYDV